MEILLIQESFEDVINDVNSGTVAEDKFWVSLRDSEQDQKLYEIQVKPNQLISNDLEITDGNSKTYTIHHKSSGRNYKVKAGKMFFRQLGISSVNRLKDDNLIMGTKNGTLIVYNLVDNQERVFENCHFMDITEINIFPSQEVIMTTGLDHQIILWSVKQWKRIRTFKTLNSSNVELIGKGRNFLTGDANGELKMWECGSGENIYTYSKIKNKNDRINVIKLIQTDKCENEKDCGELEFETKGKQVFIGYDSGDIKQLDLFTKSANTLDVPGINLGISSLQYHKGHLIIGTHSGQLIIYGDGKVKFSKQLNQFEVKLVNHNDDLFVYNGEETLVMIKFDFAKYIIRHMVYLTGLPEYFKVQNMIYDNQLIVASDYGVMIYSI